MGEPTDDGPEGRQTAPHRQTAPARGLREGVGAGKAERRAAALKANIARRKAREDSAESS